MAALESHPYDADGLSDAETDFAGAVHYGFAVATLARNASKPFSSVGSAAA